MFVRNNIINNIGFILFFSFLVTTTINLTSKTSKIIIIILMELINEKKHTNKHSLIHFWKLINSSISKSFFEMEIKTKTAKMKWNETKTLWFHLDEEEKRRRRKRRIGCDWKKLNWIFLLVFFWMKLLFNSILYGNFHIFIYGFFLSNTHTSIYRFSMKSFGIHHTHNSYIYRLLRRRHYYYYYYLYERHCRIQNSVE